ncbi:hypothetical protein [Algivirga pacifica]|uniref:hypothetical protein n=1 Tax=Algivirga pacifica TaxID=1162670 RepID=UPI0031F0DD5D
MRFPKNITSLFYGVIGILWLSIHFFYYYKFGVRPVPDTTYYYLTADTILGLENFDLSHYKWYFSYGLFLSVFRYLQLAEYWIIGIQLCISLLGMLSLMKTVYLITQSHAGSLITAFFYLGCFKLFIWNFIISTESLFISSVIISFYLWISYHYKPSTIKLYLTLVISLFTCFLRPTGIGLLIGIVTYGISRINPKLSWSSISLLCILGISLLTLVNYMLTTFQMIDMEYAQGHLIHQPKFESLIITPPTDLYIPSGSHSPLIRIILFYLYNPLYGLQLAFSKLLLFTFNIRPYFSVWNNLFSITSLSTLYFLGIYGILHRSIPSPIKFLGLSFILFQGITVMLTIADVDGRFILPVIPVMAVFGGIGGSTFLMKKYKNG